MDYYVDSLTGAEYDFVSMYTFVLTDSTQLSSKSKCCCFFIVAHILNKFYTLPETESKTFTVSGLEYYATAEDIPMDVVQEIASQLVAEEQEENDSDPNFTYTDVELYGIFFMTGKEDAWADENQLHFVIHYDMLEDDGSVRFSYYIPFYIKDIIAAADGTVTISREDCASPLFYDTAEDYIEKYEEDYDISQIK